MPEQATKKLISSLNVPKHFGDIAKKLLSVRTNKSQHIVYAPSGASQNGGKVPSHLYKQFEFEDTMSSGVDNGLATLGAKSSEPKYIPLPPLNAPSFLTQQYPELTFICLDNTHRLALAHHWTHLDSEDRYLRFFHHTREAFLEHRAQTMDLGQPRVFAAFDKRGVLIATAEWALDNPKEPVEKHIAECAFSTLPQARGQGLAKKLALWCALDCHHNHIDNMVIYFLNQNDGAKALANSLNGKFSSSDYHDGAIGAHFDIKMLMNEHPLFSQPYIPFNFEETSPVKSMKM